MTIPSYCRNCGTARIELSQYSKGDLFALLLTASRGALRRQRFDTAYHLLAAATHEAVADDNAERLAAVARAAREQQTWMDTHAPRHEPTTPLSSVREFIGVHTLLVVQAWSQAQMRALNRGNDPESSEVALSAAYAQAEAEKRLRKLTNVAFEGIVVTQDGMICEANPAFAVLFGFDSPAEAIGVPGTDLAILESREVVRAMMDTGDEGRYEATLLRRDGTTFRAELRGCAIYMGGRPARITALRDISEQRRLEETLHQRAEQLRHSETEIRAYTTLLKSRNVELEKANVTLAALAATDGLTGLKNHRAFNEHLALEVEAAEQEEKPLSLILIDVDHFKCYNDAFGHQAGDTLLKEFAGIFHGTVRANDMVARYGGEEFVFVLPDTDQENAAEIAERLRAAIEQHPWEGRAMTISLGVSTLRKGEKRLTDLIARADQALYQSKGAGRNRVTTSE